MMPLAHFASFVALSVLSTQSLRGASPAQLAALPAVEYVVFAVLVNSASALQQRTGRWKHLPSEQEPPASSGPAFANGAAGSFPGGTAVQFRRTAWLAGAAAAAAAALRAVRFIRDPATLSQTLEILVVPALIGCSALPHLRPWTAAPRQNDWSPQTPLYVALTFLLAFVLIGTPVGAVSVALAIVQIILDAVSLLWIKDGLCAFDGLHIAQHATTSAACASLFLLPFLRFVRPMESQDHLASTSSPAFMTLIALGVATKAALYTLLRISLSALTPALAIFPRNLVLLGISSIDGLAPFRQRSMQLCLIYLAGTVGAFCLDEDVGAVVRLWRNERGPTYGEVESKTDGTDGSASRSPSPHRRERGGGGATPCEEHVASSSTSLFRRSFIPFVPLAMLALVPPLSTLSSSHGPSYSESSISSSLYSSCARLPRAARPYICPLFLAPVASQTVDLVISYYNEDVTQVRRDLEEIRTSPYVASRQNRVVLYNKGPHSADFLREKLALAPADEVVPLPNLGREGATYLSHILLHYNQTVADLAPAPTDPLPALRDHLAQPASHLRRRKLADMTYFFQAYLAWHDILECGTDSAVGLHFPMIARMWSMFRGQLCPPNSIQSGAWSGQFAVSKCRIIANPYEHYAYLSELLEAPEGHWVHEGWGPNNSGGPSNPIFGHAVERSWPSIFDCAESRIQEECPDGEGSPAKCHCFDS
ncbi:hypothetical protein JCM8115_002485 [Rhodotorula mucilaginosa]